MAEDGYETRRDSTKSAYSDPVVIIRLQYFYCVEEPGFIHAADHIDVISQGDTAVFIAPSQHFGQGLPLACCDVQLPHFIVRLETFVAPAGQYNFGFALVGD